MAKNVAVVIGINYTDQPQTMAGGERTRAGLNPLLYAEADASDLATALEASAYEVTLLLGSTATYEAITEALLAGRQAVSFDGVLLVHFAGHGDVDADQMAYLLP